jgi:hypothetical protein
VEMQGPFFDLKQKKLLTFRKLAAFKSKIQNFYIVFTAKGFSMPLVSAASFIGISL